MSKPIVIYHGNCADGFSAAWVFWDKYGDAYDYYPGAYQEAPPDVTGRNVFLVDFSYKRPVVEEMLKTARSVTLVDHHKTAIEDLGSLVENHEEFWLHVDTEHSGCVLAWRYVHGDLDRMPALMRHVEDRDLWRFALPRTREIQACLFSYEYTWENWDRLMALDEEGLAKMADEGAALERKHFKDIRELLKVCQRRMCVVNTWVPVASLPYTMSSDAGHIMAEGEPFAACYWDSEEGRHFSLRSAENGLDVSEIAKLFGGGGHKHAAGFKVSREHPLAQQ